MIGAETLQPYRSEQQVGPRNSVGNSSDEDRTEQLVDRIVVIIWANQVFSEYAECNGLPKQNSKERKHAENLITRTSAELLKNPQDITIAQKTWRGNELSRDGAEKPQEPFSKKVKEKMLKLMADNWDKVTPEQLAELVRIDANNDESHGSVREFVGELLKIYFNGPRRRRNQRIEAYYNFVSGVLDLAEEDEAFREGMKIALHATDILPKDPSLVEQTAMLSLPTKEEKKGEVFQQLLASRCVIAQVRFLGSWDLAKHYEDRGNFIRTNSVVINEGEEKRKLSVIKQTSSEEASALYKTMTAIMSFFASASIESLSEERKQDLMRVWPYGLVFRDPLYQKFERVLSDQLSRSSQVPS